MTQPDIPKFKLESSNIQCVGVHLVYYGLIKMLPAYLYLKLVKGT